ncbi:MAG TPA: recombination mediator RecR [Actinomycetota bacterium]
MFEGPVQDLIEALRRLPGIGVKSAQRLAFYLLKTEDDEVRALADAIIAAKEKVAICRTCYNVSEGEHCNYCRDPRRDPSMVCVVEEPPDIVAVERTQEFRGRYHVLGGHISPMDGIGPDDLRIKELLARLQGDEVREVIVATNPNVEGEATAIYLANLIKPLGVRVTRIASGLPVGGDLEYADEVTLGRALEGRRDI